VTDRQQAVRPEQFQSQRVPLSRLRICEKHSRESELPACAYANAPMEQGSTPWYKKTTEKGSDGIEEFERRDESCERALGRLQARLDRSQNVCTKVTEHIRSRDRQPRQLVQGEGKRRNGLTIRVRVNTRRRA
jgi:hypothetical protein